MTATIDLKIDWRPRHFTDGALLLAGALDEAESYGILEGEKNELARLLTTEMRMTHPSAVDETVKCSRVSPLLRGKCAALLVDE